MTMGHFNLFPSTTDDKANYLAIRERFAVLMNTCFGTLMSDEVRGMSRRLNLYPEDTLDHHAVGVAICDVAAFHARRGGETAVARMLRNLPAEAPPLDRAIVSGWQQHRWSIFAVTHVRRGLEVGLRDTLDGTVVTARDLDLAAGARVGDRLACRLVPVDSFWITTGPAFGIDEDIHTLIRAYLPAELQSVHTWPAHGTPERDDLTLRLITALHAGPPQSPSAAEPLRKMLCPCGSGKKYKHCCGKGR